MTVYVKVREVESDYERSEVFAHEGKLRKGNILVIANECEQPVTAEVIAIVKEYIALGNPSGVEETIAFVDMQTYEKRVQEKSKKALLLNKMKEKVNEVKMLEMLKKYSEKDDSMRALMKEYESNEIEEESELN